MAETLVESMSRRRPNKAKDEYEKLSDFAQEFKQVLLTIYNLVVGCDPVNLPGFIARELEVLMDKNNLKDMLEKKEKSNSVNNTPNQKNEPINYDKMSSMKKGQQNSLFQSKKTNYLGESLNETFFEECCGNFIPSNRVTSVNTQHQMPHKLEALLNSSIIQAITSYLFGKKNGALELKIWNSLSTDNVEYVHIDPCTLAWETNGKNSIFHPKLSPLQNFKKAYPHLFKRLKAQYKEKNYVEKCVKIKPYKCPSYWCKKKLQKPKLKQIEEKVEKTLTQEKFVEEEKKDEPKTKQNKYLAEIVKMYNALAFKYTEMNEEKLSVQKEEKIEVEKFTKETQTPFCKNCANHDIVEDQNFYGSKHNKKNESFPQELCYNDLTYLYRPQIQLDWKKFLTQENQQAQPKERKWFNEERIYVKPYDYNLNLRSWRNEELLKPFTFSEDTPGEPFEFDTPDDVTEICCYNPKQKKFIIKNSSFYHWDATNTFLAKDCPDALEDKTLVNILYSKTEKMAKVSKADSIDSIPFAMLETLSGPEQEARPATPDKPDIRKRKKLEKQKKSIL